MGQPRPTLTEVVEAIRATLEERCPLPQETRRIQVQVFFHASPPRGSGLVREVSLTIESQKAFVQGAA